MAMSTDTNELGRQRRRKSSEPDIAEDPTNLQEDPASSSLTSLKKRTLPPFTVPSTVEDEVDGDLSPDVYARMSRSERKRHREKRRRSEVNRGFDDLRALLSTIEPSNETINSEEAPMNRVDLIALTVQVMDRLHKENEVLKTEKNTYQQQQQPQVQPNNSSSGNEPLQQQPSAEDSTEDNVFMMIPYLVPSTDDPDPMQPHPVNTANEQPQQPPPPPSYPRYDGIPSHFHPPPPHLRHRTHYNTAAPHHHPPPPPMVPVAQQHVHPPPPIPPPQSYYHPPPPQHYNATRPPPSFHSDYPSKKPY